MALVIEANYSKKVGVNAALFDRRLQALEATNRNLAALAEILRLQPTQEEVRAAIQQRKRE